MSSSFEIEHKYLLLDGASFLSGHPSVRIEQFYFSKDSSRKMVSRMRKTITENGDGCGAQYEECHKIGSPPMEIEYQVPVSVYKDVLKYCRIGNVVEKIRFSYTDSNMATWDIDCFNDLDNGSCTWVAEIELESENSKYEIPNEFGKVKNVSNDVTFKNWYLAGLS